MSAERYRHNRAFRRIAGALRLTKHDTVEIVGRGGIDISPSQADGWRRNPETRRKPDAGSHDPSDRERRGKPIDDEHWQAFWQGLASWLHDETSD